MTTKRKSPTTLAGDTGKILKDKGIKRIRTKHYELIYKWKPTNDVINLERALK